MLAYFAPRNPVVIQSLPDMNSNLRNTPTVNGEPDDDYPDNANFDPIFLRVVERLGVLTGADDCSFEVIELELGLCETCWIIDDEGCDKVCIRLKFGEEKFVERICEKTLKEIDVVIDKHLKTHFNVYPANLARLMKDLRMECEKNSICFRYNFSCCSSCGHNEIQNKLRDGDIGYAFANSQTASRVKKDYKRDEETTIYFGWDVIEGVDTSKMFNTFKSCVEHCGLVLKNEKCDSSQTFMVDVTPEFLQNYKNSPRR